MNYQRQRKWLTVFGVALAVLRIWNIDAGLRRIIIGQRQPYNREGLQRFAKEVMLAFQ